MVIPDAEVRSSPSTSSGDSSPKAEDNAPAPAAAQPAPTGGTTGGEGAPAPGAAQESSTVPPPVPAAAREPLIGHARQRRSFPILLILAMILGVLTTGVVALTFALHILKDNGRLTGDSITLAKPEKTTKQTTPGTKKPDMYPLLCTFNILNFKSGSVLPSDGTCDMIFLDSLYRNGKNPLSDSPTGVINEFLNVAGKSRKSNSKTKMGLAFDSHSTGYKAITPSVWPVVLKAMWDKYSLSYYGALDGNIRAFDSPDKAEALWKPLYLLRAELVKISGANTDYAVVLGVTSTDMSPFMKKIAENAKDVNGPTHFVIVSHTSYSNFALPPYNKPGKFPCIMLPPLVYSHADAYNTSYFSTMNDSSQFLQYLRNPSVAVTIPIALSVTLKGRWFTADAQNMPDPQIYKGCNSITNVEDKPPYSVCHAQNKATFKNRRTNTYAYGTNDSMAFVFETEFTLRYKLCGLKSGVAGIQFGLGVYDIDADTDVAKCDEVFYQGQYKRLMLLRKLNDYMKSFTKVADCGNIK